MENLIVIIVLLLLVYFWHKEQKQKKLKFIQNYKFSPSLLNRVKNKHDYLTDQEMKKVEKATLDYFYICHQASGKMVSMPSEIVDVLWHEFILFTREYEMFCKKGFGRFLHHTPTEAMKSKTFAQKGIKRAWRLACLKEAIEPTKPKRLPLLFRIDKELNIKGGFTYTLNCKSKAKGKASSSCGAYCASDIGCTSCGSDSANSAESSSSGDASSSDGGGWFSSSSSSSDSSCGGGCGGGGD